MSENSVNLFVVFEEKYQKQLYLMLDQGQSYKIFSSLISEIRLQKFPLFTEGITHELTFRSQFFFELSTFMKIRRPRVSSSFSWNFH